MFLRCITEDMAAILSSKVVGCLQKMCIWQEGLLLPCILATDCPLI